MNPPGKALKRGVTSVPDAPAPAITIDKPKPRKAASIPGERSAAPVFRILGLLLIILGVIAVGAGLLAMVQGSVSSLMALYGGVGCLFWAALMYAIAEVLVRLGEISVAVRKQAGE